MFGLIWLALPVAFIAQAHLGAFGIVITLVALAAIGAFWAMLMTRRIATMTGRLGAVAVLGIACLVLTAALGPGWGVLAVFATTAAAWTLERRSVVFVIFALPAAVLFVDLRHHGALSGVLIDVLVPFTIGSAMLAFVEFLNLSDIVADQQKRLSELMMLAERNRIARDLHDSLGHSLMTVIVKTRLLKAELRTIQTADVRASLASLQVIEDTVRTAVGDVRRTVADYQSVNFTGLLESVPTTLRAASINVHTDLDPRALESMTNDQQAGEVLGWTLRECATNILKHSSAKNVDVRLRRAAGRIEFVVVNDGVPQTRGPAPALTTSGNGVIGMRARVTDIGGVLTVRHEGERFTLGVSLPEEIREEES